MKKQPMRKTARANNVAWLVPMGSAFLSADLGLALEPRIDHAGYVESLCAKEHKFSYVLFIVMCSWRWPVTLSGLPSLGETT